MAQFDVYRNSNRNTRQTYPFLVDVQHEAISDIDTRLAVPLTALTNQPGMAMRRLTPEVLIEDQNFLFMTPLLASVPVSLLRQPVGTLESARYQLTAALDLAFTGI